MENEDVSQQEPSDTKTDAEGLLIFNLYTQFIIELPRIYTQLTDLRPKATYQKNYLFTDYYIPSVKQYYKEKGYTDLIIDTLINKLFRMKTSDLPYLYLSNSTKKGIFKNLNKINRDQAIRFIALYALHNKQRGTGFLDLFTDTERQLFFALIERKEETDVPAKPFFIEPEKAESKVQTVVIPMPINDEEQKVDPTMQKLYLEFITDLPLNFRNWVTVKESVRYKVKYENFLFLNYNFGNIREYYGQVKKYDPKSLDYLISVIHTYYNSYLNDKTIKDVFTHLNTEKRKQFILLLAITSDTGGTNCGKRLTPIIEELKDAEKELFITKKAEARQTRLKLQKQVLQTPMQEMSQSISDPIQSQLQMIEKKYADLINIKDQQVKFEKQQLQAKLAQPFYGEKFVFFIVDFDNFMNLWKNTYPHLHKSTRELINDMEMKCITPIITNTILHKTIWIASAHLSAYKKEDLYNIWIEETEVKYSKDHRLMGKPTDTRIIAEGIEWITKFHDQMVRVVLMGGDIDLKIIMDKAKGYKIPTEIIAFNKKSLNTQYSEETIRYLQ